MKLHPEIKALLAEIESFRRDTGLNATQFGLRAVGDGNFIRALKMGREPMLSTLDRARDFMKKQRNTVA